MAIVLTSPMWPPASMPEHTTASAPKSSIFLATLAEGTTGITLMPAAFQAAIKFLGEPAPVDTTGTFSSMMTCEISSTFFMSSMTLTPKGLSVSSLTRRMFSRSASAEPTELRMPRPPALLTAAVKSASDTAAMPP